jgi:hypothetical protein
MSPIDPEQTVATVVFVASESEGTLATLLFSLEPRLGVISRWQREDTTDVSFSVACRSRKRNHSHWENVVSDVVFLVAANLVALAGFASAFAKTIQEPDPYRLHRDRFLKLSNARWFCLVEFGLGGLLLLPVPMTIQAGAAAILAATIIGSEIRHAKYPEEESEGFGSMSPRSQASYMGIGIAVAAAAALVIFEALRTPRAVVPIDPRIIAVTITLLIGIGIKLRRDQARGQGYAYKGRGAAGTAQLPPDLLIGGDARGSLVAQDLSAAGRSALIVGLSPESQHCRDVYGLLNKHADLLGRELTVIALAQNDHLYRSAHNASLYRLVDAGSHLSRFLDIHARPYAMLVGQDLNLLAPPSQTPQKVQRLITLLVTSITNAPTTLLSLDSDDRQI